MRGIIILPCVLLALLTPASAAPLAAWQERPTAKTPPAKAADKEPAAKEADAPPPAAPTEKSLLAAFSTSFKPSDGSARVEAINVLGDSSRSLPDGGAGKAVARALARGLLDEELEVRAASIAQLGWGRHVDTAIEQLGDGLSDLLKQLDRRLTRPDEESRTYVGRATRIVGDASAALANYRDDRSVELLVVQLRSLDKNSTGGNNLSTRVLGPMSAAVLSLGTQDAVEAAVRQTQTYVGAGGAQQAPAKILHAELSKFAVAFGQAPPEYSENVSVAWNQWWEKVGDRLPKSLGRLKLPPASPPAEPMKGMRDRKDDGTAPRQ